MTLSRCRPHATISSGSRAASSATAAWPPRRARPGRSAVRPVDDRPEVVGSHGEDRATGVRQNPGRQDGHMRDRRSARGAVRRYRRTPGLGRSAHRRAGRDQRPARRAGRGRDQRRRRLHPRLRRGARRRRPATARSSRPHRCTIPPPSGTPGRPRSPPPCPPECPPPGRAGRCAEAGLVRAVPGRGRRPRARPALGAGRPDRRPDRLVDAAAALAQPPPSCWPSDLPAPAATSLRDELSWWSEIAAGREPMPRTAPGLGAGPAGRTGRAGAAAPGLAAGTGMLHGDLRIDNVLIDASGQAWLCDWTWPCLGAPWFDTVTLLVSAYASGLDADALLEPWAARRPRAWTARSPRWPGTGWSRRRPARAAPRRTAGSISASAAPRRWPGWPTAQGW